MYARIRFLIILQVFLIQKDTEAKGTYRGREILRKDDLELSTQTKRNKNQAFLTKKKKKEV